MVFEDHKKKYTLSEKDFPPNNQDVSENQTGKVKKNGFGVPENLFSNLFS